MKDEEVCCGIVAVIVVIALIAAYPPLILLLLIGGGILAWQSHKEGQNAKLAADAKARQEAEAKMAKERAAQASRDLKARFLASSDVELVDRFIQLHWLRPGTIRGKSKGDVLSSYDHDLGHRHERGRLRDLVETKGFGFHPDHFDQIITERMRHLEYLDFRNHMLAKGPFESVDEIVRDYVSMEGARSKRHIPFLKFFLAQEFPPGLSEEALQPLLSKIQKAEELRQLERSLRGIEGIQIEDLPGLSASEFGKFLRELFERAGYTVASVDEEGRWTRLIMSNQGQRMLLLGQNKVVSISPTLVAEAARHLQERGYVRGIVVLLGESNPEAAVLAEQHEIELIDSMALKGMMDTVL